MSNGDDRDRLAKLTPEQRRLLEIRMRQRGLSGAASPGRAPHERAGAGANAGTGFPVDEGEAPDAWRGRAPERPVAFSLYFFSDDGSRESGEKYRLALE